MTLIRVVDIAGFEIYINVNHIESVYRSKIDRGTWVISLSNKTVVTNFLPRYIEDRL